MPYAKPNDAQSLLFGEKEAWKEEWDGMPEFDQKNLLPEYSVRINFANVEDLKKFAELIQQPLTTKTSSIWFPAQLKADLSSKVYVNEA
jgi:hypothetical protein